MRLYSRLGAVTVVHGDWIGTTGKNDALDDIPHEFGQLLHIQHVNGLPAWEDDAERKVRLEEEELARQRDPAQTYNLLNERLQTIESAKEQQAKFDAAVAAAVEKALTEERAKNTLTAGEIAQAVSHGVSTEPVKRSPGRPRKTA